MLEVTKSILKCTVTHFRILKGTLLGTTLFCLIVIVPNVSVMIKILVGFFFITVLVFLYTFCIRNLKCLLRFLIALYLTVILIGGTIAFLAKWYSLDCFKTLELIPAVIVITIIIKGFIKVMSLHKREHIVKVILGISGEEIPMIALIDNGNGLIEPISKKPVSVTQKDVFPREIQFLPEKYRVIPFHAVGTKNGILEGYEMDYLKIEGEGRRINIKKPIIAISDGDVSGKKKYQMILHSELLKESEDLI